MVKVVIGTLQLFGYGLYMKCNIAPEVDEHGNVIPKKKSKKHKK